MRKEAAFDRIVFGTVARIVSHPNHHPGTVGNRLKIMLEDVSVRRVAAATIHQQQHRTGVGIALFADAVPVPADAVTGELRGVAGQTEIHMATALFKFRGHRH